MNFKRSYLFPALCAAAALSAFSGTASAAECGEIQSYVNANINGVEAALQRSYTRVKLDHSWIGNKPDQMTISTLHIQKVSTTKCMVDVRSSADLIFHASTPPYTEHSVGGTVKFTIEFDPSQGTKLCVKSVRLTWADWREQGPVAERHFVKYNEHKPFFQGCMF